MKRILLVTCAAAIGLFAVQANAADVTVPAPEETTYYLSLFGGVSLLADVKSEYDGNDLGYEVESKTGYIMGGAIGARIWDPLRAEVELSYARWHADEMSRSDDQESDVSGHLSATFLLGNVWYDIDTDTSLTPYLGGGAGVAWADADTFFFDASFGYGDGELGFAFQLGAGVKYDLTENIA